MCGWTLPWKNATVECHHNSLPTTVLLEHHLTCHSQQPSPSTRWERGKWKTRRANTSKLFDRTAYMMTSRQRENKNSCNSKASVLTGLWQTSEHEQCHRATADCCCWSNQENSQLRTSMFPVSLCTCGLSPPLDDISATIYSESHKVIHWVPGSSLLHVAMVSLWQLPIFQRT